MNGLPESIHLRPRVEADDPFLFALYASTREAELAKVDWPDEQKRQFLAWQFAAQTSHYDDYYGDADFLIIESEGIPIGRLYVDRREDEVEIIDIALIPESRGRGLGTILLQSIIEECQVNGRPVKIFVENFNPARHLYDRLRFQHVDTNGIYHVMRWSPERP